MNIEKVRKEKEKLIKQYTVLYHYAKPRYKVLPKSVTYTNIENMVKNKLYTKHPFNLTTSDVIHYCSKKLFKKWKKTEGCLLNVKISVLFDLTDEQYNYIISNRNRLLKKEVKK